MINKFLKKIFAASKQPVYPDAEMNDIIKKNRESLKQVQTWIDQEAFAKSYYKYGVPDYIMSLLDKEINNDATYSDLMLHFSEQLSTVNYLELGVSVGKNFFQMANGFTSAKLTGFDIENINPVLKNKFSFIREETWDGLPGSLRTESSTLSEYKFNTNSISYVAGDIWNENCWARLKGNKFNIIFSDALHTPEALLWEYKMIDKYELLDDSFIIIWDDLNNGLDQSFYLIAESLKAKQTLTKVEIIKINGWLGQNESLKHDVGIVTNLQVD
jgi:hypothetical protein